MGNPFSEKIGPLPAGVWMMAIGGGIGASVLLRRAESKKPAAALPAYDPNQPGPFEVGTGGPVGGSTPVFTPPPAPSAPGTNEEWSNRAFNELVARGTDPATAQSMLTKFLAGDTLSLQERALLSFALGKVGLPPIAPPPPLSDPPAPAPAVRPTPPPSPTPASSPTPPSWVYSGVWTVPEPMGWVEITRRIYGTANFDQSWNIYKHNEDLGYGWAAIIPAGVQIRPLVYGQKIGVHN